jgi:hypothetical protein
LKLESYSNTAWVAVSPNDTDAIGGFRLMDLVIAMIGGKVQGIAGFLQNSVKRWICSVDERFAIPYMWGASSPWRVEMSEKRGRTTNLQGKVFSNATTIVGQAIRPCR